MVFNFLMTSKSVKIAAALLATCALAASAVAATKQPAQPKSIVLGKTANYPDAACATARTCQVVARVTGIQMAADGTARPFQIPKDGQLVSYWLKLPKLTETQIKSFNKLFGGDPSVRIAVLRKGIKGRYRLVRESDTVQLRDKLGAKGRVSIRLAQPLDVKQGDFVGLTAVTWMPSFAVGLGARGNYWLASRAKARCQTPSSSNLKAFQRYYKTNDAHLQASTAKLYQCPYQTARLLYWARIVPTDTTTPTPAT